ncbi:hypothetical protein CAP48_00265 [Advenella sp. S44]|uniref:hypothetical protein n=1 Tax=Advenella sp. S44 TaxID=1982755 RepID=UPI000C29631F|nr:hypothetical protein [Advenella sp. S44]PJX27669.1 hypothetical protein CAP48_00265 [Advenella sp. S44]
MLSEISTQVSTVNGQDYLVRWRQATTDGNDAFDSGSYRQAIGHYDFALALASECFGVADDADTAIAAYVIAHHNLADTYEQLGRKALQRLHLCLAHERLCAAMNDRSLPQSWQDAAMNHSRRTYTELTRFLSLHPDDKQVQRTVSQGAAGITFETPIH